MATRLCSFQNQAIGGMIDNLLQSRGLHPISIYTSNVVVAGADLWYELKIPEEEEKIARKIVIEAGYENALAKT